MAALDTGRKDCGTRRDMSLALAAIFLLSMMPPVWKISDGRCPARFIMRLPEHILAVNPPRRRWAHGTLRAPGQESIVRRHGLLHQTWRGTAQLAACLYRVRVKAPVHSITAAHAGHGFSHGAAHAGDRLLHSPGKRHLRLADRSHSRASRPSRPFLRLLGKILRRFARR